MEIVWIVGILTALIGAGVLISRKRDGGASRLADQHNAVGAHKSRRRFTSSAYSGSWGYGGGDGGGGFGGGFDGGGCGGGDGGGGGSC